MRATALLAALSLFAACDGSKDTGDTDTTPEVRNQKPIAEAGDTVSQTADTAVSLSGAASTDPDGDALTYHRSFDHVPDASTLDEREAPFSPNHSAEAMNTSFSPDAVGTYVVKLVVEDAKGLESDPDYVIVTIDDPETVPVANAGTDQVANVGALVSLDGSLSYDPMGRTLTYAWSVVDKPADSTVSALTAATTVASSFTPDQRGVYVLNLVVDNGISRSSSDAVTVTALGDDSAPTANAGSDQPDAEDCTTIQLDCSASADPDGDPLQYLWEIQSKPTGSAATNAVSFSDRTAQRPTFYPDVAGEYQITCAVNDGTTWSTPDLMVVEAAERRSNERPTITAGSDAVVDGGSGDCVESGYTYNCDECAASVTTLGATASVTDADGDPLTYLWTTTNTDATIADPTSLVTSVTLEDSEPEEPGSCSETEFEFELTVTDCTGATVTDNITLTVSCCGVEDTSAR